MANGETIRYTGSDTFTSPLFIQEDPRNTGTLEWFAVIADGEQGQITAYANNQQGGKQYFTKLGQLGPVPFNNIVTTYVTSMTRIFWRADVSNWGASLSSWDTSRVISLYQAFGETGFNSDVSKWDVSNVTNMFQLFKDNQWFDQPLNTWNVAKVTNMSGMFLNASRFNRPLNSWITSSVTNMTYMFNGSSLFLQNLSGWNVDSVSVNQRAYFATEPMSRPENSGKLPPFK